MIAFLMAGLALGYALVYSGMSDLNQTPVSTVQALFGPKSKTGKAAAQAGPVTTPKAPRMRGGGPISGRGHR